MGIAMRRCHVLTATHSCIVIGSLHGVEPPDPSLPDDVAFKGYKGGIHSDNIGGCVISALSWGGPTGSVVEVWDEEPPNDHEEWQHVTQGWFPVGPGGIRGENDSVEWTIPTPPGRLGVLFSAKDVSFEDHEDEIGFYRLQLWPIEHPIEFAIVHSTLT